MPVLWQVIGKRVLQLIPVLFGVTFITFLLLNLLPGDTAVAILGDNATKASLAALREQLGLNQPLLVRYGHWTYHALSGNFGHSLKTNQSVVSVLVQRVPVSLELLILAFVIALALAIPFAALAAAKSRGIADRISTVVAMLGLSVPNFVFALVLILVLAVEIKVLPATGYAPISAGLGSNLRTMILPALSMSFALFATYTRMLRADMAEQIATEDYVVAAQAKGISQGRLLVRHVLKNSLFGLISVVGVNFGTLIGATVIVETIFALPGVGQLLISSINTRDVTVVQGVVVVMAVVVVVANLCTDLLYALLDPRVRHGRAST